MKILQISSGDFFSTYGGGQIYVKNLVDAFIDLSHQSSQIIPNTLNTPNTSNSPYINLSVISFVNYVSDPQLKNYRGIDLWELPVNITKESLENVIKKINPQIIHAHSNEFLICRIVNKISVPVIITAHHGGLWCPAGAAMDCKDKICNRKINHKDCLPCVLRNTRTGLKFWYPFVKHLPEKKYINIGEKLRNKPFVPFITPIGSAALYIANKKKEWEEIVEKCSVMIAPSHKMAEVMIANGMPKEKIKVIPHGIPLPEEISSFPEIKDGKIKFFYVGRICYIKGIHVLLEAFSKVKNSNIELHLIGGFGNKGEKRYKEDLQKKYQKDSRIIWHGKVSPDKIFEMTKDYHIAVSPSICLEAFGLNIAEALALWKPVLSTKSGGGDMQIKDGINGWIVPSNDVEAIYEKIKDITLDFPNIKTLSNNCFAESIEKHVKDLINLYNQLNKNVIY